MFTFHILTAGVVTDTYYFNTLRECIDKGRESNDFLCLNREVNITNYVKSILNEERN